MYIGLYTDEQYPTTSGTVDENVRVDGRETIGRRRHGHPKRLTNTIVKSVRRAIREIRKKVRRNGRDPFSVI